MPDHIFRPAGPIFRPARPIHVSGVSGIPTVHVIPAGSIPAIGRWERLKALLQLYQVDIGALVSGRLRGNLHLGPGLLKKRISLGPTRVVKVAAREALPGAMKAIRVNPIKMVTRIGNPVEIPVDQAFIAFNPLILASDMNIVIDKDIKQVIIFAPEIIVEAGSSMTWEQSALNSDEWKGEDATDREGASDGDYNPTTETRYSKFRSPDGLPGRNGGNSPGGPDGHDAPFVSFWTLKINRFPILDLPGQDGGRGGRGGNGGKGGDGCKGLHSASNIFNCMRGPGYGGDGGKGGKAGNGGKGGTGGDGGTVELNAPQDSILAVDQAGVIPNLPGGRGGLGGLPGTPGRGGDYGRQGSREGWCSTAFGAHERDGRKLDGGESGGQGPLGDEGSIGSIVKMPITEEEWNRQLGMPHILRFDDERKPPTKDVTVFGANFTNSARIYFDGQVVTTRFVGDSMLIFTIPADTRPGLRLVTVQQDGETSNTAELVVTPLITSIVPGSGIRGTRVTVRGHGFSDNARIRLDNETIIPESLTIRAGTGTNRYDEIVFDIPSPTGRAFEDPTGRIMKVSVTNLDGEVSEPVDFHLRAGIDVGFRPEVHGYSFPNANVPDASSWETFQDTYGETEVYITAGLGVGAAFYALYRWYFGEKYGLCCGFSVTSLANYWEAGGALYNQYSTISQVAYELTVAHGKEISEEILSSLHIQCTRQRPGIKKTLDALADAFRTQINNPGQSSRKAPLLFFLPSGEIWQPGWFHGLEASHVVVPYRIEFGDGQDNIIAKIFCYDNRYPFNSIQPDQSTWWVEITGDPGRPHFEFKCADGRVDYRSHNGYTIGTVSLDAIHYEDVDMPLGLLAFLSPINVHVKNSQGKILGLHQSKIKSEIPNAFPNPLNPNMYVIPWKEELEVTVTGIDTGKYSLILVDNANGRMVQLEGIQTSAGSVDKIMVGPKCEWLKIAPQDGEKRIDNVVIDNQTPERIVSFNATQLMPKPGEDLSIWVDKDGENFGVGSPSSQDFKLGMKFHDSASGTSSELQPVSLHKDAGDFLLKVTGWQAPPLTQKSRGALSSLLPI